MSSKKTLSVLAVSLFVVIGTYNAVVINSDSSLTGMDIKFVKRLDEVYGETIPGRDAASFGWRKLEALPLKAITPERLQKEVIQVVSRTDSSAENVPSDTGASEAAVQEELNLHLTEVVNPRLWKNGLTGHSGSLTTNDGVIQSLEVNLPGMESVQAHFAEMNGNVFQYPYASDVHSGMIYKLEGGTYAVSFSSGPLEGTRLVFAGEKQVEQEQPDMPSNEYVADAPEQESPAPEQVAPEEAPAPLVAEQIEQPQIPVEQQSMEALSQGDQLLQQQGLEGLPQPGTETQAM